MRRYMAGDPSFCAKAGCGIRKNGKYSECEAGTACNLSMYVIDPRGSGRFLCALPLVDRNVAERRQQAETDEKGKQAD